MPPQPGWPGSRWSPDLDQEQVLAHRGGVLVVLGAPGTGKTCTVVRAVQQRITDDQVAPDACLVLAPTRQAAARLRTGVGAGLGSTFTEPLARTPSSLAFAVLRIAAAREAGPVPRLLSGAEQDVILRELLAGNAAAGATAAPAWPEHLAAALATTGFRAQLRDLLMRAVEHGLEPEDLRRLAAEHDRPEWAAAGDVLAEYDEVTALSEPGSYDPAWICTAAADALEDDPELLAQVRKQIDLLVVDDAQELTASAARLIRVLHRPGVDTLLVGDPDATVLAFRGAVPARFLDLADELRGQEAALAAPRPVLSLRTRYRGGAVLGTVVDRVAERIGSVGRDGAASHRRPTAAGGSEAPGPAAVSVETARSSAQQASYVAQWLRRLHLLEGVSWDQLAVIARSGAQQETLRRALAAGGVPVRVDRAGTPLGADPAVLPLLLALEAVTRPDGALVLTAEQAVTLLTSPLGGVDPVALRRLRRRLRAAELQAGGSASADEVLARHLGDPDSLPFSPAQVPVELAPVVRVADILEAGREVAVGGGTAQDVLWALWRASGLAQTWTRQALEGGSLGARADRDLDAVLVLFAAAEQFVSRLPGARPHSFGAHVRGTEVAADTLVVGARGGPAVEVLTAQAAAGRQWSGVAVVGVQEGVWPDLRLRDTLLGAEALVAALDGRPITGPAALRAAQTQVRADELRQFLVAVSRADQHLLVTAVSSTDEQPSAFLDLVDPDHRDRAPVEVDPTLTLRGLVGHLRRVAVAAQRAGVHQDRDEALDALLQLDAAGVGGVDPAGWWDTRDVSGQRSLVAAGDPVRVSPSRVQTYVDCPLKWFLTSRGADPGGAIRAEIGTLVHEVIAEQPEADQGALNAELDRRWPDLGLPPGWVSRDEHDKARRMIQRYTTYLDEARQAGRDLVGVEQQLSVTLQPQGPQAAQEHPVQLRGAVDRLERTAQQALVIADLKTSRTPVTRAEIARHAQLGAYQVAVEHGAFDEVVTGARSGGAHLIQLGAPGRVTQEQAPLEKDPDPDWARDMVLEAGQGMARHEFTAIRQKGQGCDRCSARFCCPLQAEGGTR